MGVTFPVNVGDKFKDDIGNVVEFLDYDSVSNTVFFLLVDGDIEFSQPFDEFYNQYCQGIIQEVCDGPVVA